MEKDLILPPRSDPHLLEISGVECLSGEDFGVVRSTTVTGGFSIFMGTTTSDEVGRGSLDTSTCVRPVCHLKLLQDS